MCELSSTLVQNKPTNCIIIITFVIVIKPTSTTTTWNENQCGIHLPVLQSNVELFLIIICAVLEK